MIRRPARGDRMRRRSWATDPTHAPRPRRRGDRMRRRDFIGSLATIAIASPRTVRAQLSNRVFRIGFLRIGPPPPSFIEPFRQGLRDLGYVEGQNLVIELGLATSAEQLPEVAVALIRRNVDLIVASGAAAVLPARDAAHAIPVIF